MRILFECHLTFLYIVVVADAEGQGEDLELSGSLQLLWAQAHLEVSCEGFAVAAVAVDRDNR